jgi:hypothetical protein
MLQSAWNPSAMNFTPDQSKLNLHSFYSFQASPHNSLLIPVLDTHPIITSLDSSGRSNFYIKNASTIAPLKIRGARQALSAVSARQGEL